jgi:L-asparagine oxygenase
MVGVDPQAELVLCRLRELILEHQASIVLEAGDLLVIDNHLAVYGRSRFQARFDGTDRWLQRAFVVSDLSASAADRDGRVITTCFDIAKDPGPGR